MRFRSLLYAFLALSFAGPALAQAPKMVPYDHLHLMAPDPLAAREWYMKNLGANPGETPDRATFGTWTGRAPLPAQLVWIKAESAPPSEGSVIDSIGVSYADLDAKVKQLEAAGVKIVNPVREVPGLWKRAVIQDPSGVKIELVQDPTMLGLHHIALRVGDPEESLKWYVNAFGGERTKMKGQVDAIKYGDLYLLVVKGDGTVPSQGRAIDHLGFGPTDMDATAADLKAKGLKFTSEPSPKPNQFGHRTAYVEGPGGVRIELVMHAELQNQPQSR